MRTPRPRLLLRLYTRARSAFAFGTRKLSELVAFSSAIILAMIAPSRRPCTYAGRSSADGYKPQARLTRSVEYEDAESKLIKVFEEHVGRRPLGNRMRSARLSPEAEGLLSASFMASLTCRRKSNDAMPSTQIIRPTRAANQTQKYVRS
jgi:hypothetical protein